MTEESFTARVSGSVTSYGPPVQEQRPGPEPTAKHVADLLKMAATAVRAAADHHRQLGRPLPAELYEPVRLAYEDITDYGAQLLNREVRRRSGEVVHGTRFEDWSTVFEPEETDR